jgi:glutathione synthase/RimK-type ligase-like ATP-grasp enzyme
MLRPPRNLKAKVYVCREIDKLEQSRILSSAGLPHPRTIPLIPGLKLRPEVWGEFVIVKPTVSQVGRGVRLVRTQRLSELFWVLMNTGGVPGPRIVQEYIDHTDEGGRLSDYRCLMLFGTPLYLHKRRRQKRLRPLAEIADTQSPEIASNASGMERDRKCVLDEDVIELSRQASRAIPDHLVAFDIGRDRQSGRLVIFEMNTEGNWHFSSPHARHSFPAALRRDTYRQFDGLRTTARLLIERVRAEAI